MNILGNRPSTSVILAFVIGLILGLVVLGWYVFPVQWTDAGPQHLARADQELFIRIVAEHYSQQGDTDKVRAALGGWGGDVVACEMAAASADLADAARLGAAAAVINGVGCDAAATEAPAASVEEEADSGGGSSLGTVVFLFLALIILSAAIFVVFRRRSAMMADTVEPRYANVPDTAPVTEDEDVTAIPLARFQTSYSFGHDTFDDSFSIENATGEFMGECGVGISESIGTDSPKNVTAFEVWLFDKNDIRTVTKVVMSDHAFFDEALKAKLSPKGDPVLAREGEPVVLETASLIINAEIKEIEYGTGVLPPQSYFERMTFELSTWAKDVETADPDIEGRVDEILNY